MYCSKCGVENENNSKYCKECGQSLGDMKEKNKRKLLPKKTLIATIICMILLLVIGCLIINATSTIELNKYVTIESTGYDGYGTMNATIDWEAIEKDHGEKISFTDKTKEGYGIFLSFTTPIEVMKNCIKVEFSEKNNLSNGDKVTYNWKIDQSLTDYVKCKVKSKDGNYTVSNLEKIDTFDVFADVKVSFEGKAPKGIMNYKYTGEELGYYDFYYDKKYGLSNGDIVTISIINQNWEYYAETYGKIPKTFEQEYIVSGLAEDVVR